MGRLTSIRCRLGAVGWLWAVAAAGPASAASYEGEVRPFLERHCAGCHGADKAKADLRLDRLAPEMGSDGGYEAWSGVFEMLREGEMPPDSEPRPPAEQISSVVGWLDGQLREAALERRARVGRVVARRLNRAEFENTLHQLFGIGIPLQHLLPEDGSADGFDNVGRGLHTSLYLLDQYLVAIEAALGEAIANTPRPELVSERFDLAEARGVKSSRKDVYRFPEEGGVVMFSSSPWTVVRMTQFFPRERGRYRVRVSASAVQSGGEPVVLRVWSGPTGRAASGKLVGYFDVAPGAPGVIEFETVVEDREHLTFSPYGLARSQEVDAAGADEFGGPGLAIGWVEVEGPLHRSWPPPSHRAVFGDMRQVRAAAEGERERLEVASDDPPADARRVLGHLLPKIFRRPVGEDDLAPFLGLFAGQMAEGQGFERSVRVALTAALLSPDFLFLRERPGELDGPALAARLSYFLWSSPPDRRLSELAASGRLDDPEVLRAEVERVLDDPRAGQFAKNFVGQWLDLREIDFTKPDHVLYPEYDEMLRVAMVEEAERFFGEVLAGNLPVTSFIDSDFAVLNGRLAEHYGVPGVSGWGFRRVELPEESPRGGVMTMAAALKVSANGTVTSPVLRGAWVLDRILGKPPLPPPDSVEALEPDVRGAFGVRERLAKHRELESCASCHAEMDPYGFALESFDVIGGWREHYRVRGGTTVTEGGEKLRYGRGPAVDSGDVLSDGRRFGDVRELKGLLLERPEEFWRAFTVKLVTYATGGAPEPVDDAEVDAVIAAARAAGGGFRDLVHAVVDSPLFRNK